jgi:hypothetical protein
MTSIKMMLCDVHTHRLFVTISASRAWEGNFQLSQAGLSKMPLDAGCPSWEHTKKQLVLPQPFLSCPGPQPRHPPVKGQDEAALGVLLGRGAVAAIASRFQVAARRAHRVQK